MVCDLCIYVLVSFDIFMNSPVYIADTCVYNVFTVADTCVYVADTCVYNVSIVTDTCIYVADTWVYMCLQSRQILSTLI